MKFLKKMPSNYIIFIGLITIFGMFLYITNNWSQQVQMILGGLIILVLALGIREEREPLSLDEAKKLGLNYVKQKVASGTIKAGTIREVFDGALRMRNGKPWLYEVAVTTTDVTKPYYVMELLPMSGKVVKGRFLEYWSADEAPHLEIVTPPDIVEYMKKKREIEGKIEGEIQ